MTFVRNHAQALLACDFLVAVTARFRVLYVFVIMEVGCRRIKHFNVTAHPTAEWTLQHFRDAICGEEPYRHLIHDRDRIYSPELDSAVTAPGLDHAVVLSRLLESRKSVWCAIEMDSKWTVRFPETVRWWAAYSRNLKTPNSMMSFAVPEPTAAGAVKRLSGYWIPSEHSVLAVPTFGGLHPNIH